MTAARESPDMTAADWALDCGLLDAPRELGTRKRLTKARFGRSANLPRGRLDHALERLQVAGIVTIRWGHRGKLAVAWLQLTSFGRHFVEVYRPVQILLESRMARAKVAGRQGNVRRRA